MNSSDKQFVREGDIVTMTIGHSEVAMHLKVAGTVRPVLIVSGGAQILNHDGTMFSFPVLPNEAGIYTDSATGRMYVPSHLVTNYKPRPQSTVVLYITRKVDGKTVHCSTDSAAEAVIERFGRAYEMHVEHDEMGRRFRVICPPVASALLNPPPAVRLCNIARDMKVPATIED